MLLSICQHDESVECTSGKISMATVFLTNTINYSELNDVSLAQEDESKIFTISATCFIIVHSYTYT